MIAEERARKIEKRGWQKKDQTNRQKDNKSKWEKITSSLKREEIVGNTATTKTSTLLLNKNQAAARKVTGREGGRDNGKSRRRRERDRGAKLRHIDVEQWCRHQRNGALGMCWLGNTTLSRGQAEHNCRQCKDLSSPEGHEKWGEWIRAFDDVFTFFIKIYTHKALFPSLAISNTEAFLQECKCQNFFPLNWHDTWKFFVISELSKLLILIHHHCPYQHFVMRPSLKVPFGITFWHHQPFP